MDFEFTEQEKKFREEVREFLKKEPPQSFVWDHPEEGYGMGAFSRAYGRRLGEKGWISLTWPKEYGGQVRSLMELFIFKEEMAYHRAPLESLFLNETVPELIIHYGSERAKRELLPRIASGEIIFWLGYSEPEAGSDLLSLTTRAVEEGDHFIVNGQKVWSSWAHMSDWVLLLVKTDPEAPKSRSLSILLVDKQLPGVTVRPLISAAGLHTHNEVFFDDVKVPKDFLIGKKNEGLRLMFRGLESDRFWGRCIKAAFLRVLLEDIVKFVSETPQGKESLSHDPTLRHRLADMAVQIDVCQLLTYRAIDMLNRGKALAYEASVLKLFADELGQRFFKLSMDILGSYGPLKEDSKWAFFNGELFRFYLYSAAITLAGGTSEIQRDTIAVRGLGLPRE